jgi:hypothetical protein
MNHHMLRLGMHRKLVMVAIVGVFAALIVPGAFAAQPTIQRSHGEILDVVDSCGFPVQVDLIGQVVDISYTDALGNFYDLEAAPQDKETLTNLVTGKTVVVNVSGPGQYTFGADGSFTLVGTGLWSWTNRNPATFAPGMFLTEGRFVLSISASGVRTFTSTGTTINLCDQLA